MDDALCNWWWQIFLAKRIVVSVYIVYLQFCCDFQCKKYISEEEASHVLYRNETWNQYRDAMWQRLLAPYQDGTNVNKSKRRTSPLWQRWLQNITALATMTAEHHRSGNDDCRTSPLWQRWLQNITALATMTAEHHRSGNDDCRTSPLWQRWLQNITALATMTAGDYHSGNITEDSSNLLSFLHLPAVYLWWPSHYVIYQVHEMHLKNVYTSAIVHVWIIDATSNTCEFPSSSTVHASCIVKNNKDANIKL